MRLRSLKAGQNNLQSLKQRGYRADTMYICLMPMYIQHFAGLVSNNIKNYLTLSSFFVCFWINEAVLFATSRRKCLSPKNHEWRLRQSGFINNLEWRVTGKSYNIESKETGKGYLRHGWPWLNHTHQRYSDKMGEILLQICPRLNKRVFFFRNPLLGSELWACGRNLSIHPSKLYSFKF